MLNLLTKILRKLDTSTNYYQTYQYWRSIEFADKSLRIPKDKWSSRR